MGTNSAANELTGHVLRRMTFGPTSTQQQRFAGSAPGEVITALLADQPLDVAVPRLGDDDDSWAATEWWLDVMRRPDAGLHERMIWFWHGHLTSSADKASAAAMVDQHRLLRRHALGNFRTMLHEITVDAAMLHWLDGAGSQVPAPNENYARELMELFALGRDSGAYTEIDVRAGAQALAGYWVDDDGSVVFEPDSALGHPVEFLGVKAQTSRDVIDAVCDHPMCARHVAGTVYNHFLGTPPPEDVHTRLATVFRDRDLEIAPLVAAVVTDPSFLSEPQSRPRSALEWFLALERLTSATLDTWTLELLGQLPLHPPNVAGWPQPDRWVSSGALLTKAQTAIDEAWDAPTLDANDPVGDVIRRAGLAVVTASTRATLDRLAQAPVARRELSTLLHAGIAMSPEFSLT